VHVQAQVPVQRQAPTSRVKSSSTRSAPQARIQVQLEALRFTFLSKFKHSSQARAKLARDQSREAKSELVCIATPGMNKLIYSREILLRRYMPVSCLDLIFSNPNPQSRSSLSRVKLISSQVGVDFGLLEFEFEFKVSKLERSSPS
jgi:hypothetical protein